VRESPHVVARFATIFNGHGLEESLRAQPDLVLLDLMMPQVDGVNVSRRIKEDPTTAHIPIVVMSASNNVEKREGLRYDALLPKPSDLDALFQVVEHWLA